MGTLVAVGSPAAALRGSRGCIGGPGGTAAAFRGSRGCIVRLGGAAAAWFILHPVHLPELPLDTRLPEGASTVGASLISWGVACLVVGLAIFFPLRSLRRQKKILF